MLGRVVEGRYAGASVHRLPDRNVLYFQTEDGRKIALSRKNVLSVENVTDQYPDYGRKVMMVIWTDYEASIFAIGIPPVREEPQEEIPAPAVSVPMPYEQAQEEPRKKKKAGKILLVVLGILGLMAVVGIVVLLTWHRHTWTPATCTAPKTCEECGETEGTRRPHEWVDATCEEAKTCTSCGKTKGDPLGHTWEEATCETAKTCSVCGDSDGVALAHTWIEATCTSAKICSICNKIEGSPLSHNYTWTTTREPSYTSEGQKEGICKECGETATESIDAIVPEYHWNEPVNISEELQIGMYNDGTNYWIEIKAKTMNTSRILTELNFGIADLGFDVDGFL